MPNDPPTFPGNAEATANPAHVPIAFTHTNQIENEPSLPGGEQSNSKTRPKACSTQAAVPCVDWGWQWVRTKKIRNLDLNNNET